MREKTTLSKRISSGPLSGERVATRVRSLIFDSELLPGSNLPTERELCETLDLSRTAVRDGLAQLRAEGIIASQRGSGYYVRRMGHDTIGGLV